MAGSMMAMRASRKLKPLMRTFATTLLIGRTVDAIDQTGLNITVQNSGSLEKLSLQVVNSAVMKGIRVRDRVTLELDDMEGRVVKILKHTHGPKEVPEPGG
jgi:hypothetical protein